MKWKCRDGRILDIKDMDTGHLRNVIARLRRHGVVTPDEYMNCAAYACSSSSGEYAAMAADQELAGMKPWRGLDVLETELQGREGANK